MNSRKKIIVIGGPTASGKTSLSIQLAQALNCPILSADSRQFYKEMTIGTAKPTIEELSKAEHYFIGNKSIQEPFTVGDYEKEALALCTELFKKYDYLVLVGGSGLFIDALTIGLNEFPDIPESVKESIQDAYEQHGLEYLQVKLKKADPEYYDIVDLNNPVRLMRALTVTEYTGKTFSSFRNQQLPPRPFTSFYFALDWDREVLYNRINKRVDLMLNEGLLDEVKNLYPHKNLVAMQTVGYQEFFEAMDGKISQQEAIDLVKRNSRRYAKRQMTWLRRESKYHLLKTDSAQVIEDTAKEILKIIE